MMEEESTGDSTSSSLDEGVGDMFGNVHVGKGFYINKNVYERLHDYQKKALLWFWDLHRQEKGGILGDDMGLGKTIQVITFLRGLMDTRPLMKLKVLIVAPVTLLQNWEREFDKWAPSFFVHQFHGQDRGERERVLNKAQSMDSVLLTSYGLVRTCWHELSHNRQQEDFVWDYMICDEGHRIKNPSAQTTMAAHAIYANHRFILTGTPIQNNLDEFWALFSFVDGSVLGTRQAFRENFATPITEARNKEATEQTKAIGNELSDRLRRLTQPYFLHRRKEDVLKKKERGKEMSVPDTSSCDWQFGLPSLLTETTTLSHKNDLVMWLSPSSTQIDFYQRYVNLKYFKQVMKENDRICVFVELMILKSLCDHPRLLSKRACALLGLTTETSEEDDPPEMECGANNVAEVDEDVLMEESGKLVFLFKLLENLRDEGHRCLVFSRSLKMLNIIERILATKHFKWKRLDGSISNLNEREELIQDFQEDISYNIFLLTTQVGGIGLNLTGADRVVIVDPSWNPSTDNQAVDRAYRIGQTRSVVVYRLITCGTIEEKIYRRQVFKESIIKQTMGKSEEDTYRYFTSQELRDLFVLEDTNVSVTQRQLEDLHAWQRQSDRELDDHLAFLKSIVSGISDHDLLFSLDGKTLREKFMLFDPEYNKTLAPVLDFVQHAVKNENLQAGCSTKKEEKPSVSTLHEQRPAVKKSLVGNVRESKAASEVIVINDSSSDEDDSYFSNPPQIPGVKMEKTQRCIDQLEPGCSRYAAGQSMEMSSLHNVSTVQGNPVEGGVCGNDESLEVVKWRSSPVGYSKSCDDGSLDVAGPDDVDDNKDGNCFDDVDDNGIIDDKDDDDNDAVDGIIDDKDDDNDAVDDNGSVDDSGDAFHVKHFDDDVSDVDAGDIDNCDGDGGDADNSDVNVDDSNSDSSSIICLEDTDTNSRTTPASDRSENCSLKQEEEGSPAPKKAKYEGFKYKWLDR